MAVTNYLTVNGRIRGESANGVRTDYLTDALGSVVATVDSTATVVNTYRYKPYGEKLAKEGSAADPGFLWRGTRGLAKLNTQYANIYTLRGAYSTSLGMGGTALGSAGSSGKYDWFGANPTADGDPMPPKDVCLTGPPQITFGKVFDQVVPSKNSPKYDVICGQEVWFKCLLVGVDKASVGRGSIPQWVNGTVEDPNAANPSDRKRTFKNKYDDDMTKNCDGRKGGNPSYAGQINNVHFGDLRGQDLPGYGLNRYHAPTCTTFEPDMYGEDMWITSQPIKWRVTFTACCSCQDPPSGATFPDKKAREKSCKDWTFEIDIVYGSPPTCKASAK